MRLLPRIACLVLAALSAWSLPADGAGERWHEWPLSNRVAGQVVHDIRRHRLIAFGSFDGIQTSSSVWEYALDGGTSWRRMTVSGAPPVRRDDATLIYDAAGDRMVLFGGRLFIPGTAVQRGYHTTLADTWELTLGHTPAWSPLPSGPARAAHSAVYDPEGRRMLVFGGITFDAYDQPYAMNDLWALSLDPGGGWSQITLDHPVDAEVPGTRSHHASAWDAHGKRMIVHGGIAGAEDAFAARSDTWAIYVEPEPRVELVASSGPPGPGTTCLRDSLTRRILLMASPGNAALLWELRDGGDSWTELAPGNPPPARSGGTLTIDPRGPALLLYGQRGDFALNDLWSLDLRSDRLEWVQKSTTPSYSHWPGPRSHGALTWDPETRSMLLFGGMHRVCTPCYSPHSGCGQRDHNDLWVFSSEAHRWIQWASTNAPSARREAALAVDTNRHRLLVFGGYAQPVQECYVYLTPPWFRADLWERPVGPDASWQQLFPVGVGPSPRAPQAAIFDAAEDRLLLLGGAPDDTVWSASFSEGGAWQRVLPENTPPGAKSYVAAAFDSRRQRVIVPGLRVDAYDEVWSLELLPAPRWRRLESTGQGLTFHQRRSVYDPAFDRLLVWGGSAADTWALDLTSDPPAWSLLEAHGPRPRANFAMAFDESRAEVILFGGSVSIGAYDTWWMSSDLSVVASATRLESAVVGSGVRLRWQTRYVDTAELERRLSDAIEWRRMADLTPDPAGVIDWVDLALDAGARPHYRLRIGSRILDEFEVQLPSPVFGIHAASPQPVRAALEVRWSAPGPALPRFDLFDVQGRRVFTRAVAASPMLQTTSLDLSEVPAGAYVLRLIQGRDESRRRLVVVP